MSFWEFIKILIPVLFAACAVILVVYHFLIRKRMLNIGADREDISSSMPGDGMVSSPGTRYTQSITIHAPKNIVWSYIIQFQ